MSQTETRPICAHCTRNARTIDTPHVKVRVEHAIVLRDGEGLRLVARCHGHSLSQSLIGPGWFVDGAEETIARLELFRE